MIDAETFEPETYTSEQSGKKLRKIKIRFLVNGEDALERYHALEKLAAKKGVISEEPDGGSRTLWKSSEYFTSFQDSNTEIGTNWYEAIWVLREQES